MTAPRHARALIPLTPPWGSPPLTLNQRLHWARANRLKRDLGLIVRSRALKLGIPRDTHLVVWLRWQPVTKRRRDGDNPAPTVKAAVDALVKAGVLIDDTTNHVTHAPLELLDRDPGQTKPRLWLAIDWHDSEDTAA